MKLGLLVFLMIGIFMTGCSSQDQKINGPTNLRISSNGKKPQGEKKLKLLTVEREATVTWTAPDEQPDPSKGIYPVVGYKIYYGPKPGDLTQSEYFANRFYPNSVDAGSKTNYSGSFPVGSYLTVVSVNAVGLESFPRFEVVITPKPNETPTPSPTRTPTPTPIPNTPTPSPAPTATPRPTATPTPTPTPAPRGTFVNISTRAKVGTGEEVMIAGFIIQGAPTKVIVRAIGPSLTLNSRLANPTLELRTSNGALLVQNDDWRGNEESIIKATGIPPINDKESAVVRTLPVGAYTVIVRGKNNTMGIALVEVYNLN